MHKLSLFLILLAVCFSFEEGFAQWSPDSTINTKVCQFAGDQKYPEIVTDGAGGAIIVWQDGRGTSTKIYAQRIDSSGIARWTANGIVICTADNSQFPKLTSDGVGGAIITWFDLRNGWPNSYVCAQRVNGNGDTLWKANGVALSVSANSWAYPAITGYGSDGAIVTWIGVNSEIYAQKIDTSGIIQWTAGGVVLAPSGSSPQITIDNSGGAIVCWFDYSPDVMNTDIFAQRVNSSGAVMWLPTGDTICYFPNYQQHPECVSDGSGGAIVSWQDSRYSPDGYVYAQKVGAGGETFWAKNGNKVSTTNSYSQPRIASDDSGGAILTWLGGSTTDIYAQRINGSGVLQWPNDVQITFNTTPNGPRIWADGAGGAFIIWEGMAAVYIRAQHINSDGAFSFPVDGKTVSIGTYGKGRPVLVTDGKGNAIIAWEDSRPIYNSDIYVQRIIVPNFSTGVSRDGQLETAPREFTLSQNYPNPFNPQTKICYSVPKESYITLKVYDLLGKEVAILAQEKKEAGEYSVVWNAGSVRSGVYFYRMQAGSFVQTNKLLLMK